jgi:hypothetical protein
MASKEGGDAMRTITLVVLALCFSLTLACSSPQDRAYHAQRRVHSERLKLVDEYKKCLKKAGDDKEKIEACDQYLRAAEALK